MSGQGTREPITRAEVEARPRRTGTQRVNGYFEDGEGSQGKHRLNITDDRKWFIEFDKSAGVPQETSDGSDGKPTHTVKLDTAVKLIESRDCDVGEFIRDGGLPKRPPGDAPPVPLGDANYEDWTGDPTSRGMAC